jgi:hypothetical protein
MKLRYILAGFCIVLVAFSCKKSNSDFEDTLYSLSVDECETVQSGADQMTICTDLLNDSRCPDDVVCGTAGHAYADFTATINNTTHSFTLYPKAFAHNNTTDTTIGGFKIEFLDIIPHRRMHAPPAVQEARLRITHP